MFTDYKTSVKEMYIVNLYYQKKLHLRIQSCLSIITKTSSLSCKCKCPGECLEQSQNQLPTFNKFAYKLNIALQNTPFRP